MTKKTYAEKLLDPRWQKKRLEILQRDEWKCRYCGNNEITLHIHHEKYEKEPWEVDSDYLKTCCKDCHAIIEKCKENEDIVLHIERSESFPKVRFTAFVRGTEDMAVVFIFFKDGAPYITNSIGKEYLERFVSILNSF